MIYMVDDEPRYVVTYLKELERRGYKVRPFDSVDAAWAALQADLEQVQLVILDIMMSSGEQYSPDETQHGLRTGVRFYEEVHALAPRLPVVMLTNVTDSKLIERFRSVGIPWFPKYETFADELGDWVDALFEEERARQDEVRS